MLTVKQLLVSSETFKSVLSVNSRSVSIAFAKTREGKDPRGYYRAIPGRALSKGPGKRQKNFEIRLYYPVARAKKDQFIPKDLRPKNQPYVGPEKPPDFTLDTKVWVSCNCEWFLYACEVADEQYDSSSKRYSNGKGYSPDGPNPRAVPHLCKHLIASLRKGALLKK